MTYTTVAVLVTVLAARPLYGQHHGGGASGRSGGLAIGAQAVVLGTHVTPAMLGRDLTEGYVTQPSISAMGSIAGGRVSFNGMLNLEGLTLKRGELNHSVWGEGYIDRRHPHTYLHEAVLTGVAGGQVGRLAGSATVGRGFVPYGTDDPMVRGFVKYPSNHHLSQILERWVAIGAVKYGPAIFEAALFNGDEPTGPSSFGQIDRFGDSWSVRGTLSPFAGVELQSSFAHVTSPELPNGGGLNQRKLSYSGRVERDFAGRQVYLLAEHSRSTQVHGTDQPGFEFTSSLIEAASSVSRARIAVRYENSTRPEEERLADLFRSLRPSTDNSILGTNRWKTWSASVGSDVSLSRFTFSPFVELARSSVQALDPFPVNKPADLYGSEKIWSFSAGTRIAVGMQHKRMGRYGVAVN
ncbi:MAG TPA: hypothetical protein VM100_10665 [Longimicrobiales bacterium]|nr:hypothetical protein [Longimicrobiales bacterium]